MYNKLILTTLVLLLSVSNAHARVSIGDTNVPVIAPAKALYGQTYNGSPVRLMEVDSSGAIEIDNGAVGASFSGALTVDGATTFSADPTFTSATTDKPDMTITNTNADATGVEIKMNKNSASPADNDVIGEIQGYSDDSAANSDLFFEIELQAEDITSTTEDGSASFQVMNAGTLSELFRLESADATFTSTTASKPLVNITNVNTDANSAILNFNKNSASSAADDDDIALIKATGYDDGDNATIYGQILVESDDVTNTEEDGSIVLSTMQAGTLTEILKLDTALTLDSHLKVDGAAITALTDADTTITAFAGKGIVVESVDFDGGVVTGVTNLTASGTADVAKALADKLVLDNVQTFTDEDATPDVSNYSYFNTNTTATTITDFDGAGIEDGQLIYVVSKGAITYDVTDSGIKGGTTDIVTAAGDLTVFLYDGTDWIVVSRMDMSDDLN